MITPTLTTRFTDRFNLTTPIALAPMALAAGGALAAACARAGALGLVGGGYGDVDWVAREYGLAASLLADDTTAQTRLGCGFITWKLDENAAALDAVLRHSVPPAAIMLSFGDPLPYAARIKAAGAALICQVQRVEHLALAVAAGADVIVVQGGEAGGHGINATLARSVFTLVPEAADFLAQHAPQTLLLAAGGIADGRGLAAALMLGADGVLVGSRLWATVESLAPMAAKTHVLPISGDGTARSAVFDVLRRKNWPTPYDFRAVRNDLYRRWEDRIDDLRANPEAPRAEYDHGVAAQDFTRAHVTVGEAVGLISDIPNAADWLTRTTDQAKRLIAQPTKTP